jgi:dihydroorotate dehydrogenase electron transfer subunit
MSSTTVARGQFTSIVKANLPLCREHFRLVLLVNSTDQFPPSQPGQFVQLMCRDPDTSNKEVFDWELFLRSHPEGDELISPTALLRRPFSLAGRRDTADGVELDIIHRVVGVGTDWLSKLKAGDSVNILGPLGNRFELPSADSLALLVGGGVGIPPMLYLAEKLQGRKAVVFAGALSKDLLPFTLTGDSATGVEPQLQVSEFFRYGIPAIISTDDGSYGYRGFITQALDEFLNRSRSAPTMIYTCGPEGMMKRVAEIAAKYGLECQIAVERAMACGMGTCQSCCIKVKKADADLPPLAGCNWAYRRACTDGPVFRAGDLLW